jgi:hypothetical protein
MLYPIGKSPSLTVGAAAVVVPEPSAQPAHRLSRTDAVKPIPGIDSGQDRVEVVPAGWRAANDAAI